MSSAARPENVARLIAALNLEFDALPDNLMCAECKAVLKDACQVPCGCRFCRACIDGVLATGVQFCPGGAHECGETPLSAAQRDYGANRSILRLLVKCPNSSCSHECPLADMEGHLRVCPRKSVLCPFRELGCLQGKLAAEELSGHLQRDSHRHSEMLVGVVAHINGDMDTLRRADETSRGQVEILKQEFAQREEHMMTIMDQMRHVQNESKSIKDENKSIKDENKSIKDEIKSIKDEIKSIKNENKSIKDENKSIKDENKSIKREREVLSDRVRQLSEQVEREMDERRQSSEVENTRITAITGVITSNLDTLEFEMGPVKDDIKSINRDIQSIRDDIDSMKSQAESTRAPMGMGQVDAKCNDWLIDADLGNTDWWEWRESDSFTGAACPYTFGLASENSTAYGVLWVWLRVLAGSSDSRLDWPFRGMVTVTIAHRHTREASSRLTRQCCIERPPDKGYRWSDTFEFRHSQLEAAGLDLARGVLVSCQIASSEVQS